MFHFKTDGIDSTADTSITYRLCLLEQGPVSEHVYYSDCYSTAHTGQFFHILTKVTQAMFKRATVYTGAVWRRLSAFPVVKLPELKVTQVVDTAATPKFPWVQRYKYSSTLTNLYDAFRLKNTFEYMCFMVDTCTLMDSMRGKLIAKGESAFTSAAGVIFNQNIPKNEEKRKIEETYLDKKLKYFFANALQKHLSCGQRVINYTLYKVDKTRITDMKLLVNAQRGVELPEHDFVTRSYGLFCFLDDSKINSANPLKLRQHIDGLLDTYSVCTVQVKISLDCTGSIN